jgi:hypothetical protein
MTQTQVNTGYGTYGPQTTAAVAKLQQNLGMGPIAYAGYYGPLTQTAINTAGSTSGSTVGTTSSSAVTPGSVNDLSTYLNSTTTLPNGAIAATNNGQVVSPTNFTVPTTAPTTASLTASPTTAQINTQQGQYQMYLQQLATASGYTPDYMAAYNASQNAQFNSSAIANQINQPTGPGATFGQLQTTIARAQTGNAQDIAASNIALQAQALIRQGNINAATALVQGYSPSVTNTTVSPGSTVVNQLTGQTVAGGIGGLTDVNAVNQYNSLQQMYPGAGIPAYNTSLTPAQNQQVAQSIVANSPQYGAQFQSTYTTPGGGTGVFDKTLLSSLSQNSDGTYSLVSGAAAALGSANAAALGDTVKSYNSTSIAFDTVDKQFGMLTQLMTQYGLNQAGIPLVTQLQNKVNAGLVQPGVMGAFNLAVQELRTNLSTVISRGNPTNDSASQASTLVPDNLSPSQMGTLGTTIKTFGQAAVSQIKTQADQISSNISSSTVGPAPTTTTTTNTSGSVGGSWAGLLQ